MSWWEVAYRGAKPPGGLIPLARPLYPPDAAERGKKPSDDGPDCEGIRRGISRLGRAPWDWATGDNKKKWSNTLAHGAAGGNVGDSGAAGFQRQMDIDATGWWGEASHNALQYALIPAELPHAGEHGLDDRARELLRQAVEMFKGPQGTVRERALAEAKTWLGYEEASNGTSTFGSWYGMPHDPWCMMFVTYCHEVAGPSPSFVRGERYAYCPYVLDDAQSGRNGLAIVSEPRAGDLILYDWSGGVVDHVGLFETWTGAHTFQAIEGNTSSGGSQSNGGAVLRRQRDAWETEVHFVRVDEP